MLRKLIVPVATLALLTAGLTATRAADPMAPTTAPAAKAKVTVKVVDTDGKAVDGATVDLTVPGGRKRKNAAAPTTAPTAAAADPAPAKRAKVTPIQTTTTDADGGATLADVPDGSYVVAARLKGSGNGRERVTVADGQDASVTVTIKKKAAN